MYLHIRTYIYVCVCLRQKSMYICKYIYNFKDSSFTRSMSADPFELRKSSYLKGRFHPGGVGGHSAAGGQPYDSPSCVSGHVFAAMI